MAIDPAMALKIAQLVGKLGMYLAQRRKAKRADQRYNTTINNIRSRGSDWLDEDYRREWDRTGDEEGDKERFFRELGY
jgi:hypothetical protein